MSEIWNGRVLEVVPYVRRFIGDQVKYVGRRVSGVDILHPAPRLSGIAASLPGIAVRYNFFRPRQGLGVGKTVGASYLATPLRSLRKRSYSSAAKSAVKAVSRSGLQFDIVHAHFLGICGHLGAAVKTSAGKPLVVTAYGGDAYATPYRDQFSMELATGIISKADRLIAVSRSVSEKLVELGASEASVRTIPNGVDLSTFKPGDRKEARNALGLDQDKKILLTVANLVKVKGHEYLLEAMAEVRRGRGDVILILAGGGVLRSKLEKKAADLGLNKSVVFLGDRPHSEIPKWVSACDLFVLPSLNEGLPTVLAEVMACGRPIVATRVGGIPEVVTGDGLGLLVEKGDSRALASAIVGGLEKAWDQNLMLEAASRYGWDSIAGRIVKVYQELS
ncbi:MAG: glycosyltransferase family 4 protein [Thaumarchaeota archaeon]|nr:glycosyltransferase family 4 protein [Nitrososphaerota archaeon]